MYLAALPLYRIRLLSRNIHLQNYTKLILGAFAFLQITCLDISSGGGLGVSTSTDGTMKIWQAANGEIRVRAFGLNALCCLWHPWSPEGHYFSQAVHTLWRTWLFNEKLIEIWHLRGFKSNLLEKVASPKEMLLREALRNNRSLTAPEFLMKEKRGEEKRFWCWIRYILACGFPSEGGKLLLVELDLSAQFGRG